MFYLWSMDLMDGPWQCWKRERQTYGHFMIISVSNARPSCHLQNDNFSRLAEWKGWLAGAWSDASVHKTRTGILFLPKDAQIDGEKRPCMWNCSPCCCWCCWVWTQLRSKNELISLSSLANSLVWTAPWSVGAVNQLALEINKLTMAHSQCECETRDQRNEPTINGSTSRQTTHEPRFFKTNGMFKAIPPQPNHVSWWEIKVWHFRMS